MNSKRVGAVLAVLVALAGLGVVVPKLTLDGPAEGYEGNEASYARQVAAFADLHFDHPIQRALILEFRVDITNPPEGHVPEPWEGGCEPESDGGPTAVVTGVGWWWIPVARARVEACDYIENF